MALDVMEKYARGDAFVIVEFSQRAWDAYRNDLLTWTSSEATAAGLSVADWERRQALGPEYAYYRHAVKCEEAKCGRPDDVKALLGAGATVDAVNKAGVTPLIYAASEGHDDCVPLLLAAGADPAHKTAKGKTAIVATKEKIQKGVDKDDAARFANHCAAELVKHYGARLPSADAYQSLLTQFS